jgi:lysozyme
MALRYAVIDDCPCPRPLYPILRKLKEETGCTYQSIYRGTDAARLLAKFGKHDQAYLYAHQGTEGIGPANPPGRSTHELDSDGVPYKGPIGRKLVWWQCGIDVDDAHVDAVIAAAHKHGWTLFRPYGAGSEFHHVNFAHKPSRWKAFYKAVFGPKPVRRHHHWRPPPHLSKRGAALIARFEGFRSAPYQDSVGVWTIGYGHTSGVGPATKPVTKAQALKLLEADAAIAATAVRDLVKVRLNQNQFDALVSFAFNLGTGALAESTLLKKLNKGDYKGAAGQFGQWVYAGHTRLEGLVLRRRAEAHLFATHN